MIELNPNNNFASGNSPGIVAEELTRSESNLSQTDFIELLVAQVKNQDPSKPLEPSQFMSQLAQFSTVNGIQELKNAFDSLASRLSSDQSLQAANLLGRNVLISGGLGRLPAGGTLTGQVNLPQQSSEVTLKITNAQGVLVRDLPLGGHERGELKFQWDGFAEDGSPAPAGNYLIVAEALIDGSQQAVEVQLESRVDSVSLNQDGSGITLNLANGESVPLGIVHEIK